MNAFVAATDEEMKSGSEDRGSPIEADRERSLGP